MLEQVRQLCKFAKFQPADRPPYNFDCSCEMCSKYEENLVESFVKRRNERMMRKVREKVRGEAKADSPQDLIWVLKRLIPPANKIVSRGVELYIPEICFYKDGEPSCMFLNKDYNDYVLKEIPKDRLTNIFLQKTFNERRRKYREKMILAARSPSPCPSPYRKASVSLHLAKQEPVKIDMSDAVIVKYVDGYEELIPEGEFSTLINRRRQDSIWSTIDSIKNYIPVQKETRDNIRIRFDKKAIEEAELMERARTLMRVYAGNIMSAEDKYISEEDENDFTDGLLRRDRVKMLTYLTYKVVCFIETFHDTNISSCHFQWKIDLLRHPVLAGVIRLSYEQLPKYDWTNDVIHKIIDEGEHRTFYSKTLPTLNAKQKQISQGFEDIMQDQYDLVKRQYGITVKVIKNSQEAENNQFWKKIHPECKVELSQGLTGDISVGDFRRIHLGQKKKRRLLASQFKSNLVAIIHHLAPAKTLASKTFAQKNRLLGSMGKNQEKSPGEGKKEYLNRTISKSVAEIKPKSPLKSTASKTNRRAIKLLSAKATTTKPHFSSEHSTAFYDF